MNLAGNRDRLTAAFVNPPQRQHVAFVVFDLEAAVIAECTHAVAAVPVRNPESHNQPFRKNDPVPKRLLDFLGTVVPKQKSPTGYSFNDAN
jgi:hypothetical protein